MPSLCYVEILVGETPRGRANSRKMETGRLQMKYLLLRGVIVILVYLQKSSVHGIISSSSGGVILSK